MAKHFTELAAWQLSDALRQIIVEITDRPNVNRDFKYCDQCKDAARSAASNIAEGFGRSSHREFARFIDISIGSLSELEDLLIDGRRRGRVTEEDLARGMQLVKRARGACIGLARYLRNSRNRW